MEHFFQESRRLIVISPTLLEIIPIVEEFNRKGGKIDLKELIKNRVISLVYKEREITLFLCGAGVIASLFNIQRHLALFKYDFVIMVGLAGLYPQRRESLNIGEVVVVARDTFTDIGITTPNNGERVFKSLREFPFAKDVSFFYDKIENANAERFSSKFNIPLVEGSTVASLPQHCKDFIKTLEEFNNKNPVIESMEGASLHLVCREFALSYLQLRAISNYVEAEKGEWKINEALSNLTEQLFRILDI